MDPTVREATLEDAPAIAEILADLGVTQVLAEPAQLTETRLRRAIRSSCTDGAAHSIHVAEAAGEVVGFVAVNWTHNLRAGIDGYVSDLFIHSRARGNGAGTLLLERVKEQAAGRGCARLVLLEGKGGEAYEREFYAKRGWTEHDEMACFMLQLPPPGELR